MDGYRLARPYASGVIRDRRSDIDMRLRNTLRVVAAAILLQPTSGREAVVIHVTGTPSWTVGRLVRSGDFVEIPAGAEIRLLTGPERSERVLRLTGPFSGPIDLGEAPRTNSLLRKLSALMLDKARLSPFWFRSGFGADVPPPHVIDITSGGRKCVPRDRVILWMPRPSIASFVFVKDRAGKSIRIDWPAGTDQVPWPAAMRLQNEGQYSVELPSGNVRELSVHYENVDLGGEIGRAVWMLETGCYAQAALVLTNLPVSPHPVRQ